MGSLLYEGRSVIRQGGTLFSSQPEKERNIKLERVAANWSPMSDTDTDTVEARCQTCLYVGLTNGGDGHYYCDRCNTQAQDILHTARDYDDDQGGTATPLPVPGLDESCLKGCANPVKIEAWEDGIGPTEPQDFGQQPEEEDDLRMSYVMGLQIMIELQTKVLVEEFNVSPLICGLAGTIWLRYVASSGIFDDNWATEVIAKSEFPKKGSRENFTPSKHSDEARNIYGERFVMIWYRSLSSILPLSHTLVMTYLVCHLAREAILPTDILKWSLERRLPYLSAFVDIEEKLKKEYMDVPLDCSYMFKPSRSISLYELETQAASIAQKIGLELPPVNSYAIASRYLNMLSLSSDKILPFVSEIYEWSLPSELWLSANEMRLPTRVCVLSMMIVAIRIIYNIHGFGYWEKSFSIDLSTGKSIEGLSNEVVASTADSSEKMRDVEKSELESMKLLRHLEEQYYELEEKYEYTHDLPAYLEYCKDVVFAGMGPSAKEKEEKKLIEKLWEYFQKEEDSTSKAHDRSGIMSSKRPRDDGMNSVKESKKSRNDNSSSESMSIDDSQPRDGISKKDEATKRLRVNMNDNRFCYIPPRIKVKRRDYLHYARKKDVGAYAYAAHADYYILLRCCARVAKVDVRVMHCGVMSFERRLGWLEKRIDDSLSRLDSKEETCKRCDEEVKIDISKLNI